LSEIALEEAATEQMKSLSFSMSQLGVRGEIEAVKAMSLRQPQLNKAQIKALLADARKVSCSCPLIAYLSYPCIGDG